MGNDLVAEGLAESVLSVHYMVARYPTGRPMYALCAGCEWSDSFGSVNEARTAHARHVVDVLRSNDVEVIDAVRVYAAAALNSEERFSQSRRRSEHPRRPDKIWLACLVMTISGTANRSWPQR